MLGFQLLRNTSIFHCFLLDFFCYEIADSVLTPFVFQIFSFLIIYLCIHFISQLLPTPPSSPSQSPSLLFSSERLEHPTPVIPLTLAHHVSTELGTSSLTEGRQSSQVRGQIPQIGNSFKDNPHFNCWGTHM